MATIYDDYEGRLRQANALDFDDLLLETVRLLAHDANLRAQYNRRFEFVMIDEYQDTNRSQYELMRLLTEAHKNVCVVGDEDQSIYGWRGADIRNILDFERDYPNATVIRLEQNYRSTKNILEAASAVVANNTERKGKWLWTEAGAGAEDRSLYEAPTARTRRCSSPTPSRRLLTSNPGDRVAVLYRTNFQSRQIEEALRRYGRELRRGGRIQLLPARRNQGPAVVSEGAVQPAGFRQPAARSSTRPRAASAKPPSSRSSSMRSRTNLSVWSRYRADAGRARFSDARGSGSAILSHA